MGSRICREISVTIPRSQSSRVRALPAFPTCWESSERSTRAEVRRQSNLHTLERPIDAKNTAGKRLFEKWHVGEGNDCSLILSDLRTRSMNSRAAAFSCGNVRSSEPLTSIKRASARGRSASRWKVNTCWAVPSSSTRRSSARGS